MDVFPLISFRVMGFTVYGFGLALAFGFALMWLCLSLSAPRSGLKKSTAVSYMLSAVPLAVFFGRLVFCLFRRAAVFYDMVDGHFLGIAPLFKGWEGGFSLPGLLIGLLLAVPITAKCSKEDASRLSGWMAALGALLMAFAHLGTILAGEGYGDILESPAFYAVGNAYGEWYVAVFAFEAAVYGALFVFLLLARSAHPASKQHALIVSYGALQLFLESLHRDNYMRLEANGFIRVHQLLCLALLLYGLVLIARSCDRSMRFKQSTLHFILLALAVLFVIAAEFHEKLPFSTLLLYTLSGIGCGTLALVAGFHALSPKTFD